MAANWWESAPEAPSPIAQKPLPPLAGSNIQDDQGNLVKPGQPGYENALDASQSNPQGAGNWWEGAPEAPAAKSDEALGFYKGAMKPLDNAAQGLEWGVNQVLKPLGGSTDAINSALGMPSAAQAANDHQQFIAGQAAQGKTPGMIGDIAGQMVGTAPALFEGPLVGGAMAGAALTDDKSPQGILANAAVGALGGKAVDAATRGLFDAVVPKLSPAIMDMVNRGVPLTSGQMQPGGLFGIAERVAKVTPVAGEFQRAADNRVLTGFNRAAYNEALAPAGVTLPKDTTLGPDALDYVRGVKNQAYNKVAELAPAVPLTDRYAAGMQNFNDIMANVPKTTLKDDYANFINTHLTTRLDEATGGFKGEDLLKTIGDLRKKIQSFKTAKANDAFDNQYLTDVLQPLQDHLTETLGEANPAAAAQFAKAKQINSGYMALKNTLAKTGDRQTTGEGLFVPQQLYMGSKTGASVDQKAYQNLWGQDLINDAKKTIPASGYSNINPFKDPHGVGEGLVTLGVTAADLAGGHGAAAPILAGAGGLAALYAPTVQDAIRNYMVSASRARPGLLPALDAIARVNSKIGAVGTRQAASGLLAQPPAPQNEPTGLFGFARP